MQHHSTEITTWLLSSWENDFLAVGPWEQEPNQYLRRSHVFAIDYSGRDKLIGQDLVAAHCFCGKKKVKSRRGYECGGRNGVWANNLAGSRWKGEVSACCRQEGGVGSCSLELSQQLAVQRAEHEVLAWLSEGTGECWQVTAVTEGGEHFAMLYQTGDFTENIQLHWQRWQLFCPQNANQDFCSQKGNGNSEYCKQLSDLV